MLYRYMREAKLANGRLWPATADQKAGTGQSISPSLSCLCNGLAVAMSPGQFLQATRAPGPGCPMSPRTQAC